MMPVLLVYVVLLPVAGLFAGAAAGRLFARHGGPLNRGIAVFVATLIIGLSWLHAWHVLGNSPAVLATSRR